MSEPQRVKTIRTKLVGVTFYNPNGKNRQRIIRRCKVGEDLNLSWEANNQFEDNAVAVHRVKKGKQGPQLGYLSSDLSPNIIKYFKRDLLFSVEIIDLTGGTRSEPTLGVNIEIGVFEP